MQSVHTDDNSTATTKRPLLAMMWPILICNLCTVYKVYFLDKLVCLCTGVRVYSKTNYLYLLFTFYKLVKYNFKLLRFFPYDVIKSYISVKCNGVHLLCVHVIYLLGYISKKKTLQQGKIIT